VSQQFRVPGDVDLNCGFCGGKVWDWLCGRWGRRGGLGYAEVEDPQEGVGGDAADEVRGVGGEG